MAKNILKSFQQGLKKIVGVVGWQFAGGEYGEIQRNIIAKTPEGQNFLEDYEKSFEGKIRRKIYNWTKSK